MGGGGEGGGRGRVERGGVDVIEELKFLGKLKKKKIWGGVGELGWGWGGGVGWWGGGSGWM